MAELHSLEVEREGRNGHLSKNAVIENVVIYVVIGACIIAGIVIDHSAVGSWSLVLLLCVNYLKKPPPPKCEKESALAKKTLSLDCATATTCTVASKPPTRSSAYRTLCGGQSGISTAS